MVLISLDEHHCGVGIAVGSVSLGCVDDLPVGLRPPTE